MMSLSHDMDPSDLQRMDSLPAMDDTPTFSAKTLQQTPVSSSGKSGFARIDVEPMYTALKAAIGEGWSEYKTSLHDFLMGKLNQAELSRTLAILLSPAPSTTFNGALVSTLHLHNVLLFAIYNNIHRDPPPETIASWVLATDAPASAHASKSASQGAGDVAEERLKREVMALSARDRRRIKSAKDNAPLAPLGGPLHENVIYATALTVPVTSNSAPEALPPTSSSLSKTNWDLEIRRRYAMPLASETLEFPSRPDIQARIEPICYEEGVGLSSVPMTSGTLNTVAELVETATEMFVKETLSKWFTAGRSNMEGAPLTKKYRAQIRREEEAVERGDLARSVQGFLPVEMAGMAHRESLTLDEVRLSLRLDESRFRLDPFLADNILGDMEMEVDENAPPSGNLTNGIVSSSSSSGNDGGGVFGNGMVVGGNANASGNGNGVAGGSDEDKMDVDVDGDTDADVGWGWQGAAQGDRDTLFGTLDSVLATVAS